MDYETTKTAEKYQGERGSRTQPGWDRGRGRYACGDARCIEVPRRTAGVRDLGKTKTVPRNRITYAVGEGGTRAAVSGTEFSRDMNKIFGGSDDTRTLTFPETVRIIQQSAFYGAKSLGSAVLNEGLEMLGTDEYKPDGEPYPGVF